MAIGDKLLVADKPTLDEVKGYVDTNETDLGIVKADLVTLKGYTDGLESSLGSNADASSATGSVHAKLKDIKTAIGSGGFTYAGKTVTLSTGLLGNTTPSIDNPFLTVSGSRIILGGAIILAGSPGGSLRVTVDGTNIIDQMSQGVMNQDFFYSSGINNIANKAGSALTPLLWTSSADHTNPSFIGFIEIPHGLYFASSFKFSIYQPNASGAFNKIYGYIWHIPA